MRLLPHRHWHCWAQLRGRLHVPRISTPLPGPPVQVCSQRDLPPTHPTRRTDGHAANVRLSPHGEAIQLQALTGQYQATL